MALNGDSIKVNASPYNVANENQMQAILKTVHEIIKNNGEEDELFGEDNNGNSIKCDSGSEEFEERYKNAVEFAKKHLDDEKLKYPAKSR